jgi:formylglycine-generating enzyme required for sulfatase activity
MRALVLLVLASWTIGCADLEALPTECSVAPERCCDLQPEHPACQGGDSGATDTSLADTGSIEAGDDTNIEETTADTESDSTSGDSLADGADSAAETAVDSTITDSGADTAMPDTAPPPDTAVCSAGAYACSGDTLTQCKTDRSGYNTITTCPAGTCGAALGRCSYCTPDALNCSGAQPTKCNALGSAFAANGAACVAPQTCGGGGMSGVCGCTPSTAACAGKTCGTAANGCGGMISCGSCTAPQTCGGGGTTDVCGCTPTATTTLCAGKDCGSVDNGCGTMVSCGTCTAPRTCGGGGTANKCGGCSGSLPGPTMIDGGGFCIDSTEVTQSQYQTFLGAKGTDFSGQTGFCADRPYAVSGGCAWSPSTTPNVPAVCVDWCKAAAYCKWAGKRLCGKIGGGSTPLADFDKPTVDQWHRACTVNGSVYWPYGSSASSTACVTNSVRSSPDVVKSKATCVGPFAPFDGLFDMSGNVSEWTDSCGIAPTGKPFAGEMVCRVRGGSFDSTTYEAACNADSAMPWAFTGDVFGIRCCAD